MLTEHTARATGVENYSIRVCRGADVKALVNSLKDRHKLTTGDLQIVDWQTGNQSALMQCSNKGRLALWTAREVTAVAKEERVPLPVDPSFPPRPRSI